MWSSYTTPPGPPPGYPPSSRELPSGPPAEEALNFVEPLRLPRTPADQARCHPFLHGHPIRALGTSSSAVLPEPEEAEHIRPPPLGYEQSGAMLVYAAGDDDGGASEHVLLTLADLPELRRRGK